MGRNEATEWLAHIERPLPGSGLLPIEGRQGARGWLLVQCAHEQPAASAATACEDCLHDLWLALGQWAARTPAPLDLHYHARDGSVFFGSDYLVRGVAGAILWRLAQQLQGRSGAVEFSLRSLRLARRELRLPELQDNLSVRLALLQRRLAGSLAGLRIDKIGRGRFLLVARQPLALHRHE